MAEILKPLKRRTLAEEIIEQIKEQILMGSYAPGDRLPTERELSEQLSVSRASVREAMRALSTMGLVEIRVGEGTFLESSISPLFSGDLSSKLLVNRASLLEVVEARKIIETQLAKLAASRASEVEIRKMEQILWDMGKRVEDGLSFAELDVSFHIVIAEAAGNSILYETLSTIRQLLKRSYEEVIKVKGMPKLAYELHLRIFEAIKNGSVDEAGLAMMEHLTTVENRIKNLSKEA